MDKLRKYKQQLKPNVVSIRVSDAEKAFLEEMSRRDRTNITELMREAISIYTNVRARPDAEEARRP